MNLLFRGGFVSKSPLICSSFPAFMNNSRSSCSTSVWPRYINLITDWRSPNIIPFKYIRRYWWGLSPKVRRWSPSQKFLFWARFMSQSLQAGFFLSFNLSWTQFSADWRVGQMATHAVLAACIEIRKAFNRVEHYLVIQDLFNIHNPWLPTSQTGQCSWLTMLSSL